ncbi:TfoX/Sxy family protein [Pedobacter lusitanus]|nr:TfoX/Sxy family protein [Pedobacter lusitanus]
MFQGVCFMVDEKMCICIGKQDLLCRIGAQQAELELEKDNCRQMINHGRVMKDFVYIEEEKVNTPKALEYWIGLSLQYNKEAKSSKKKKKQE